MTFTWNKKDQFILFNDKKIPVSNIVRNELNGLRKTDQVVRTIPDRLPYYPRPFPVGEWEVYDPIEKDINDDYLYPFFIPTNAWQMVDIWSTNNGGYYEKTGRQAKDSGYGLHYSESNTTLGCIKIVNKADLLYMVEEIRLALSLGEKVKFIVTK